MQTSNQFKKAFDLASIIMIEFTDAQQRMIQKIVRQIVASIVIQSSKEKQNLVDLINSSDNDDDKAQ